jgi:inner membrane protein
MDNITHGSLGILAAILTAPPELRRKAALAGFVAAELPDFDIMMVSFTDPLFGLKMHRHFTHSLVMIPVLAALGVVVANVLRRLFRREAQWRGMWLPAFAAVATHGICDTWTSYGTHLLWPFTERRESWDLISVVDPLMTLPLLVFAVLAWKRGSVRPAWLGVAWAVIYLFLCFVQQQRARMAVEEWAVSQGHEPLRLTVKPSFANIMVWRGLYEVQGECQVVCVRPGITESTRLLGTVRWPLLSAERLPGALAELPRDSVLVNDVRRFGHFSDDWLGLHPQRPNTIGDLRYALLPHTVNPLWGIVFDPKEPERHVKLENSFRKEAPPGTWGTLWQMITGG